MATGSSEFKAPSGHAPWGLGWRSSYWYTTFVVGLGIATDLLVYSIIIPVIPFQLQKLGYTGVSALTGWLLFAYSAGLVLSTVPIAMFSERYNARKTPLIIGLIILFGSQVMLMEAPLYAVLCLARILQGIGSSMVWVVGLALLCDSTPEHLIGRQLGIAMAGISTGLLIGPPVGGALYSRFGFRGPFVFGLAVVVVDLIGRILIIERRDALPWGVDPLIVRGSAAIEGENSEPVVESTPASQESASAEKNLEEEPNTQKREPGADTSIVSSGQPRLKPLSLVAVVYKLSKSTRARVALLITFVYGAVNTSQEPSIPLHLQNVWGLDSGKVGLVFLAAAIPTIFSSTLSGWYADRKGSEWVTFLSLILALPWWVIVIIRGPLALFIVAFAIEIFFTSGVVSPLTTELASISRGIEGVGYAHVYGAFNLAYGTGSAAGPVVGGQIYNKVKNGWTAQCLLATGLIAASLVITFFYTGVDPLASRLGRFWRGKIGSPGSQEVVENTMAV